MFPNLNNRGPTPHNHIIASREGKHSKAFPRHCYHNKNERPKTIDTESTKLSCWFSQLKSLFSTTTVKFLSIHIIRTPHPPLSALKNSTSPLITHKKKKKKKSKKIEMGCVNQVLILILLSLSALFFSSATAQNFKCNTPAICSALVGYAPHNKTTFSDILNLFNIKNLRNLLGANNLPLTTLRNDTVEAKKTIKIPISCRCSNGTGVSLNGPVYKVKKDDGLFFIASEVFAGLVVYENIQKANNIRDANLIEIGQNLTIPLPCSCDDVDSDNKVVHYAHVVQSGSSLESIAKEFGTDEDTLKKINDISDDSKLIADKPIDVPLKACNSSIKSDSLDKGLRVADGTYVFTAYNCVKCTCDYARISTLQCEQTQLNLTSPKWETCPAVPCGVLGNSTMNGCNRTTCTYAGYTDKVILATNDTSTTCSNPSNIASRIGSSWSFLFISSIHLIPLFLHLFQ